LLTQSELAVLVVFAFARMVVPVYLCNDRVPEQPNDGAL
jgi:hypothetical protein